MPSLNYLQGMAGRFGRGANTLGSMEDPRTRFAQQLQMESMDTSPAFVGEGISRLGKALVGALLAKRSMEDRADASRWLTAKMDDRKRQPTEKEAFEADPKLKWLQQAAMRGGPDVSQQPTRDKFATREYEDILGDFRERVPDTDDVLMGTGRIPKTLAELSVLNYLQEQHKDFPEQTEFTHPFTGAKETATAEDWVKIPKRIEEGERKFAEQMEDARQASMKYRPRDYAQELASGMEAYRSDPKHQISDPYTRMEWLRESAQGREANPFISRMLENLMFADMQREIAKEDIESARGFQTSERIAGQKFRAGESEKEREIKRKQLERTGWTLTTEPVAGGLEQKVWLKQSTGERRVEGEPYDPKILSPEALKQKEAIREAGKTTWTIGVDSAGNPVQRSSEGLERPLAKAPVSKAVEVVDKKFGEFYAKHFATGGVHDAIKNLDQLDSVIRRLDAVAKGTSEENLTGSVIGQRPDWLNSMVNPAQVDVQNTIEEVVQRNLRVVLGAQFTEKEGDRLIARAFNPKLGEAENAVRVQRLVNAMRNTLNSQMKAAEYYEKNNTLAGWKGTLTLSVGDLDKIIDGDKSQFAEPPPPRNRRDGDKFKGWSIK